ncbi:MAG: NADH-quinone oxidoreductase subunit L [Mycobacteriales bacterium]
MTSVQYVPATGALSALWLLLALPAAGAAILLLSGSRSKTWGPYLACATTGAAFLYGVVAFFSLKGHPTAERSQDLHLFSWIPVGGFKVDAGLLFDPLSATFVLLITGVGFLIHVYSLGYMEHDPRKHVFFAYLNLFVAAMLLLVLGNSFLSLYVGWEGVGLASYLLIAFWYYKPEAATAAKKAFIANRVGDVGLSLAIMLMFASVGTTSYEGVFGSGLHGGTATAIGLLLLLGACGKSGQFPLQTWLPDAMEGPTPVSALIHAATMVTAGVYLIARSTPIFEASPDAQTVVTIIGAVTLVIGCLIGCAYDDIKKVLAYSTVSQIGYMFLAVGIPGAGAFAILHLLTHGFFKACMFLSAGSVMHGMEDQVDMRRYGGLRKAMPWTFGCLTVGWLAILGIPPFAGFFSKDKIVEAAFAMGGTRGTVLGVVALLGAGITAFYMTRLWSMTFFGDKRWTDGQHPHESPWVMVVPMVLLAVGSAVAGALLGPTHGLQDWLSPVVGEEIINREVNAWVIGGATLAMVLIGAVFAFVVYATRPVPVTPPVAVTPFTVAARKNLYFDAINESLLMRPGQYLTRFLVFIDNRGIDGAISALAAGIGGGSGRLRRLQTGFVRSYALSMFGGAVLVVVALLAVRLGQ